MSPYKEKKNKPFADMTKWMILTWKKSSEIYDTDKKISPQSINKQNDQVLNIL